MIFIPCPKRKGMPWTSSTVCRVKGCHTNCRTYHKFAARLPRDMAAWCRCFTARNLEDNVSSLPTNAGGTSGVPGNI